MATRGDDLYRDWNDGARSGGAAARRSDSEFERVRRDLGDLPGIVSDEPRLRTMLAHFTKTLHPRGAQRLFRQMPPPRWRP